jgi:hypothetical protein
VLRMCARAPSVPFASGEGSPLPNSTISLDAWDKSFLSLSPPRKVRDISHARCSARTHRNHLALPLSPSQAGAGSWVAVFEWGERDIGVESS